MSVTSVSEVLRPFVDATRHAPVTPYRSLEPFRFADAGILSARDREIERLVRLITMYRGVLLFGESGVGKTSLVNAGLLPRVIEEGFWPHRARVQPLPGMEFSLEPIACSDEGEGEAFLPSAFEGAGADGQLALAAETFVAAVSEASIKHGSILLVFDQFEELVTLNPRPHELSGQQTHMIDAIVRLLRGGTDRFVERDPLAVKLLFSFREDYLAGLGPLFDRQPELLHQHLRLIAPPQTATTEIIRAPFEKFPHQYARELSPELADQIAAALALHSQGQNPPLSQLQIVCNRLWQSEQPSSLLSLRGVKGLLEDHLEDALVRFPGRMRDAAVEILAQLVTSSNTRNVVTKDDLLRRAAEEDQTLGPDVLSSTITLLETESGLIRRERRHDVELYELTSEFLIPWISRQRDQILAVRARRRQEARLRRLRWITAAIVATLIVVAALGVVALSEKSQALRDEAQAKRASIKANALALATTAQSLLDVLPDASLVLALAAERDDGGLPVVQTSMLAAFSAAKRSGAFGILHGFTNTVTSVAFDPKTGLLASGSADGTIALWSSATRQQVGRMNPTDGSAVFSIAFSPDGTKLVSGTQDGTIQLWNVATQTKLGQPLALGEGIVASVAFSPDGRDVAAAGLDSGLKIVSLVNPGRLGSIVSLPAHVVRGVAFSSDSRRLASVGNDGSIQVWSVARGIRAGPAWTAPAALYTVAFDPVRNDELAAGGLNGALYVWTASGKETRAR